MTTHKLQLSGRSYYTYLPTEWIKDNKLDKGSEITLTLNDNKILIEPSINNRKQRVISLKVDVNQPKPLSNLVISLFVAGYDEFELNFKNELTNESLINLKEIINELGLSMIDLTSTKARFYVNLNINDVKGFIHNYLNKALNLVRMLINNETTYLSEQVRALYYHRYLLQRSINRHQLTLDQLNIKSYEADVYQSIAVNLSMFSFNIKEVKSQEFLAKVKKIVQVLLKYHDKEDFNEILRLNQLVEKLLDDCGKNYHKRRVYRCLKEIVRNLTIKQLITLESVEQND